MKKYAAIVILLFLSAVVHAQTMGFGDFVDLVTLSVPQIDLTLIQTGKFKVNSKEEVYGQVITKYQTIDKDKKPIKGETMIVGAYRTTGDGIKLKTITYQTIYPAYVQNLIKQIRQFGYRPTFTGADAKNKIFVFDNTLNHITVLMRQDHSLNTIEIRQKELGVEP